jgi:hypothetical protein
MEGALSTRHRAMFNHQTAVLHDLNAGASKRLCRWGVANAGLKPDSFRFLRQNIINVPVDIVRTAKDIDKIDFTRDINQTTIDRSTEDLVDLRVINRNRDYFKTGPKQILRHVHRRLTRLRFCFDTQNGDPVGVHKQLSNLRGAFNKIFFPVHKDSIATAVATIDAGFYLEPLSRYWRDGEAASCIERAVTSRHDCYELPARL